MTTQNPWRVGVLFSQTGPTAAAETALLHGTLLAIEKINQQGGVLGRPIVPVEMDPASDENRYSELSYSLLTEQGISVIFGGYTSAGRKAMIPSIEKSNGLLFYPTFYEGFEYSDHVFYFGACPNQYTVQLVDYMMKNVGKSFYLVGANYVFPRETNRIIKELLRQAGGKVLGEKYFQLDSTPSRMNRVILDIEKKKPDVVFSILVGDQIVDFYSAFHQTELRRTGVPIASIVTTETEIDSMGWDVAEGHYCAGSYFETVDTAENKSFVSEYSNRFGAGFRANSCVEAAYNQVMVFAAALEKCGTMETSVLREAVLGSQVAAPQGAIRVDEENHHSYLWSRIGQIGGDGHVNLIHQSARNIPPDPYLINHEIQTSSQETAVGFG